jgi:hypothetical protein
MLVCRQDDSALLAVLLLLLVNLLHSYNSQATKEPCNCLCCTAITAKQQWRLAIASAAHLQQPSNNGGLQLPLLHTYNSQVTMEACNCLQAPWI